MDPLLHRLGIESPIFQSPMAGVATPEMAAADSDRSVSVPMIRFRRRRRLLPLLRNMKSGSRMQTRTNLIDV